MMEARGLIRESVSQGLKSQGFLFYLADHEQDEQRYHTGQQDLAYRHFLNWLGGTLSEEIGVLFSPTDSANRLYPPQRILDEVLDLLNAEDLAGIWSQDETIGWVYQYFTPKELRDQARKESSAPRNSYELAFRNQFFTPRYVVEFLTDNTLGRTWYEMRKGETKLQDQCRYMVRRPNEVFLGPQIDTKERGRGEVKPQINTDGHGYEKKAAAAHDIHVDPCSSVANSSAEMPIEPRINTDGHRYGENNLNDRNSTPNICVNPCSSVANSSVADLSQEELLKLPVYIPHRPKKDPREIKILDPACGSGHFLLYCFDLLLTIYEEAYEDSDLGPALKRDFSTLAELQKAVPSLILAYNLHGIDIDLRATQIAALALWLRCQRVYQEMRLKKDRPKITRSNIVCAEPMPGEGQMLNEFVSQLETKLLGQLVEVVFEKMKLAGEAGSLLKIEEEIREAVATAKAQWLAGSTMIQLSMFEESVPRPRQQSFDFSGITDEEFFGEAETKVIEALRKYSENAQSNHRLQQRLFAEDAVRGFAFVDICRKRFDVVLMNPPFGAFSSPSKSYIEKSYARTKNDVYAAFVERGLNLLHGGGRLGAITSRTGFFLSSFQKWREEIILKEAPPVVFADLGYGVLDTAMVETATYVLEKGTAASGLFLRLLAEDDKANALCQTVQAVCGGTSDCRVFEVIPEAFREIPGTPWAYWVSEKIRRLFSHLSPFEIDGRTAKQGLATADDFRFVRNAWEIPIFEIGYRWFIFAKGGVYSPFYADVYLVVDWGNDGQVLNAFSGSVIRNPQYYFRPGLTWPRRTSSGLALRVMPAGCIFADKGPAAFVANDDSNKLLALLAISNSRAFASLVEVQLAAADAAARS
ncbi:MAG: Eco57I restriction-modification methylase domain-containing protein, partial [Candidatus Methylumidiphilus sp.]